MANAITDADIDRLIYEANAERGYNNHEKGHAFERRVHNDERRNSILSVHSDGSYGLIDVVTIRKNYVLLITCKKNRYIEPRERRALDKLRAKLPSFCRIQIRYKVGHKVHKEWYV